MSGCTEADLMAIHLTETLYSGSPLNLSVMAGAAEKPKP